ncbi:MAG: isopentenyl phosphate kinase [Candidatus Bathyarchaeia archaeon]
MRCRGSGSTRLLIVKVGGSVITRKDGEATPKLERMARVAAEISEVKDRLVLIHGAGSYGHPIAARYELHRGFAGDWQLAGVSELKAKLAELNSLFLGALSKRGVAAFPLNPASIITTYEGRLTHMNIEPLKTLLDLGFTPMLHGDLVLDLAKGFSIVSGDQIASYMAERLRPSMVIFGCDVDGVYTGDPKRDRNARLIASMKVGDVKALCSLASSAHGLRDVTGGFMGKLREASHIAELGIPVAIVNLDAEGRLLKVIRGEKVRCTLITP